MGIKGIFLFLVVLFMVFSLTQASAREKTITVDTKGTVAPVRSGDTVQQVQSTKQYKTPQVPTRTKTITGSQVSNKPDVRSARPVHTAPERIQKEQLQPRTVEQTTRSRSVVRDTGRESARVEVNRGSSAQRVPTVQRRVGVGQSSGSQPNREIRQARPQGGQREPR